MIVSHILRKVCEELDREISKENVHMLDHRKQCLLMQHVIYQYEQVRRFWIKVMQTFMLMFGIVLGLDVSTMLGLVMTSISYTRLAKVQGIDQIWISLYIVQTLVVAIRILLMTTPLIRIYEQVYSSVNQIQTFQFFEYCTARAFQQT